MFRKSNVENNIVLPLQIVVHRVLFRVVSLNGVFSGVLSDRTAYLDPNMSVLRYIPVSLVKNRNLSERDRIRRVERILLKKGIEVVYLRRQD